MTKITADIRLRPIRFAFLVRPDDKKRTLEIFKVNSCLWGGKFNLIVPCFKQVPDWWDRHGHKFETAIQITNGYLDMFEPDFLVEAEQGLANGLGFDPDRVLQLGDVLVRDGQKRSSGYGLDILDLYRTLYKAEFQFVRRHKHDIVDVVSRQSAFKGFAAALFGAFPSDEDLQYFGQAYEDAFAPERICLDGHALAELYVAGFTSALRIGHSKIDVDYHNRNDPTLFVLDATQPRDLVDFWNLRAVRPHVLPIPLQWAEELSGFCKDFITRNFRPLPGNPNGIMMHANVMFARSVPSTDIELLYARHFRTNVPRADVRQDWYPSIWRPSPGFTVREARPTLAAGSRTVELELSQDEPYVRFDSLDPDFAEKYGNSSRWANVVRLRDWTFKDQLATVFPCDYRAPKFPKFEPLASTLPTTEGLVSFVKYKESRHFWRMTTGTAAINEWLKTHGITATLSEAGRATSQIIQALGGFGGVRSFAHPAIVKLLNSITRRPISPSIKHQEFKNKVEGPLKGDHWRLRNFETLVERGAVELGMRLRCSKCSSWSWYALNRMGYKVNCALCLQEFAFPIVEPTKGAEWAYRLVGPFALPNYATGGYAASLSIRFFADVIVHGHDNNVAWSAGQELVFGPNDRIEADFILWYQRKIGFGNAYPTQLVFGEAKSFRGESAEERREIDDAFDQRDVDRMKRLATEFPGSILVFSTMKKPEDLSGDEIARISKLAEWGREYVRERQQTRAPVILLTANELFAPYSLRDAWSKLGGKHEEFANAGMIQTENLSVLADLTQQLYLSLPPYSEWLRAKRERRAARRNRRRVLLQNSL
jgi:hypothetical protein